MARRVLKDMERDKFIEGDSNKPSVRTSKSDEQLASDTADFRLMISYQGKILEELKKTNTLLELIYGDEL